MEICSKKALAIYTKRNIMFVLMDTIFAYILF